MKRKKEGRQGQIRCLRASVIGSSDSWPVLSSAFSSLTSCDLPLLFALCFFSPPSPVLFLLFSSHGVIPADALPSSLFHCLLLLYG